MLESNLSYGKYCSPILLKNYGYKGEKQNDKERIFKKGTGNRRL